MGDQGHRVQVGYHQWMLEDEVRNEALEAMIRTLVRPGDVVADLGTGTGVLAVLAKRAGAARVHAVEASPIIRLAEQMARDNGVEDITFHEDDLAAVELPEPVDVAISECLGNFAFSDAMFGALGRFRERWLKPGGRVGPCAVRLYAQPTNAELGWRPARFWQEPWRGLDLRAFAAADHDQVRVITALPAFCWEAPAQLGSFHPYERPESFDLRASWTLSKDRIVSGVAAWFEVDWAPGVTLSTAPDAPDTHWGQVLFPLPRREAKAGDRLTIAIEITFDDEENPRYRWRGAWTGADGQEIGSWGFADADPFGPPLDSSAPM